MATHIIRVTTTGSAGSATGTADTATVVRGLIYAVYVDYHASAPGTTTVDLDEVGGMGQKIVDLAAGNTDRALYPRVTETNNAGTAGSGTTYYLVDGQPLRVTVAASNALTDAVVVRVQVVEL